MRRRTLLIGLLVSPFVTAARRPRPPAPAPPGWVEEGVSDGRPSGVFIAAGDDRDLSAALRSVPAGVTRAAVRIA